MASPRAEHGETQAQPGAGPCIVLADSNGSARMVVSGLTRRGMAVRVVSDAPAVMVELAKGGSPALIVVMDGSWPEVGDLLEAVRVYYPQTGCWAYRCEPGESVGHLLKLEAAVSMAAASARGVESSLVEPARSREEEEAAVSDRSLPVTRSIDHDDEDEPLISQQEMAMLLGHDALAGDKG